MTVPNPASLFRAPVTPAGPGEFRTTDGLKPVLDIVAHSDVSADYADGVPCLVYDAPWGQVTVSIETITPEIADRWLTRHNWHNRTLGLDRSDAHARDMAAGLWQFVGDTIRFATTDRTVDGVVQEDVEVLIDGQHRLDAIRQSKLAQPYIVVRGLTLDAQQAIDNNKIRSFGDTLRIDDPDGDVVKNEKFTSALTRRLLLWDRDIVLGGTTISKGSKSRAARLATTGELRAYFQEHRAEILDAYKINAGLVRNGLTVSPAVVAAAWVLLARVDRAGADLFIEENLIKMVGFGNDDEEHPARQLRQRLTRTDRWRVTTAEGFLLILHAWNLWREGRGVAKLMPMKSWPKPSEFRIR
jgi:hypothetical protein